MQGGNNIEIVWEPIPGTSQELALDSRADHTLYHGARGPGKTDTQLMRFRRYVGCGYGPFWRGVIIDREYKALADLISKSRRIFYAFEDGCEFLSSATELKWRWPTGEELLFRAAKAEVDYQKFHGQEFPFIGWNELTKYPDGKLYGMLMSVNRSSYVPEKHGWIGGIPSKTGGPPVGSNGELPPPIPLQVFSTTNPSGPGHNWVKERFIDPSPNGGLVKNTVTVIDPKTKKEVDVTKTQIAIFGHYSENIYLDPKYIAELESIKDENKRRAWLNGDWDITAGGALDDVWRRHLHVIPRSVVPEDWRIDRALDWGSSSPFAVGWFAEANGEEWELSDGRVICPAKGTIIQIEEFYGSARIGSNEGLKMGSGKVAKKIKEYEIMMLEKGWISRQPRPGPADNQIRAVNDDDTETIEKSMAKEGIKWLPSDKAKGTTIVGLQMIRDRLENVIDGEGPGLLFMENCKASIATIPILGRDEKDPEKVNSDEEDHAYDMVRYRLLVERKNYVRRLKTLYPG